MPQVKSAATKYQYDMKSIIEQSHMTKCEKYDNRREDRLLNRKLEELRIQRKKMSQLRIVEKWAILNELTRYWNTRQSSDNESFQKNNPDVARDESVIIYRNNQESRPSFPPPLARPKNPPSPVHRRPRSFRTIKADSFLVMTGPGVNTVTSLTGRSLMRSTSSTYATNARPYKTIVNPSGKGVINATGPCPSPKRPKTSGLNQMATHTADTEVKNSKKSTLPTQSTKTSDISCKEDVLSRPVTPAMTAKSTENHTASSDESLKRPVTPGTPKSSKRPGTPYANRRTWTPRPLSSTSCASSVSLRAYFAGDTVEDLFPGVQIGKVNLPKSSKNFLESYPEVTEILCKKRARSKRDSTTVAT